MIYRIAKNLWKGANRIISPKLPFSTRKAVLQALSACFGLDYGNDQERYARTLELMPRLVTNPKLFNEVYAVLPRYKAWTASGAHRFMPLALAVVNMFREENVFDGKAIQELQAAEASYSYLTKKNPFYSNFHNVPQKYVPDFLPSLILPTPSRSGVYKWLDIASAPKSGGAPTLRVLKAALESCLKGTRFEFYGTDIAMPVFELGKNGEIRRSQFYDPSTGWIKPRTVVDGITYLDAALPEYNVMEDTFLEGEPMDFISLCMALHHLNRPGEAHYELPFSSLNIVDPQGRSMQNEISLTLAPSHQKVLDRLLKRLKIGGYLFTDIHSNGDRRSLEYECDDMFVVLRREANNKFVFYGDWPIPFIPNEQIWSPSRDYGLIEGYPRKDEGYRHHPSIMGLYPGRGQEFYKEVQNIFDRAEILAYRYQGWKRGVWGAAIQALKRVQARKSLFDIFQAFLENVPDEDPLKIGILKDVAAAQETRTETRLVSGNLFQTRAPLSLFNNAQVLISFFQKIKIPPGFHDIVRGEFRPADLAEALFYSHPFPGSTQVGLDGLSLKKFAQLEEDVSRINEMKLRQIITGISGRKLNVVEAKIYLIEKRWEELNLSKGEIPASLFDHAYKEFGVIYGLVNRAAINPRSCAFHEKEIVDDFSQFYQRKIYPALGAPSKRIINFMFWFLVLHDLGKINLGHSGHEDRGQKLVKILFDYNKDVFGLSKKEEKLLLLMIGCHSLPDLLLNPARVAEVSGKLEGFPKQSGLSRDEWMEVKKWWFLFRAAERIQSAHFGVSYKKYLSALLDVWPGNSDI
ncbi:MAG: hypothetical protein HQ564_00060 [Candidatus Saganbacteria bacterium]|nr:hypothetical protein [Candidatus Saganbacteria bacterium]